MSDLEQAAPALARGLKCLLQVIFTLFGHAAPAADATSLQFEGDVENVFCRCMQVEYECFGEMTTTDLVPDGGSVPVTAANRELYVQLFVQVNQLIYDAVSYSPHAKLLVAARGQHFKAVQRVCKRFFQCLWRTSTGNVQTAGVRVAHMRIADTRFSRSGGGCHFRRRVR